MTTSFLQAILEGGIRNPNFFNGRVLTAQDLRDTQVAEQERVRRLGQALGEGVAYGLFASKSGTSLALTPGLAFNRRGDALALQSPVTLPMSVVEQASAGSGSCSPFAPCTPGTTSTTISPGFYLLAITSTTGLEGRAPSSALNAGTPTCTARYEVEGVQFKLLSLDFTDSGPSTTRRNRLAHACFGTAELLASATDPFLTPPRYGLIDKLRKDGSLMECDVPLAVVHWANNAIQFVDVWPGRRPLTLAAGNAQWPLPAVPAAGDEAWSQHASGRRAAEGLAAFLQFQEQIEELRVKLSAPQSAAAATYFSYLPAAGYLPLSRTGRKGFQWPTFFARSANDTPATMDAAFLRELFHRSFYVDAIAVPSEGAVPVDLYMVEGTGEERPYIVFVRRERLAVVVAPGQGQPTEPVPAPGSLAVVVTDPSGNPLPAAAITSVTAVDAQGVSRQGQLYGGSITDWGTQRLLDKLLTEMAIGTDSRKTGEQFGLVLEGQSKERYAIYLFDSLPSGSHTVKAVPTPRIALQANSKQVTVPSGGMARAAIPLRNKRVVGPLGHDTGKIRPDKPWVLDNGHVIGEITFNHKWAERRPPRPGDPVTDPVAEWQDWRTNPPNEIIEDVEVVLADWLDVMPGIAASDPAVYVRPDYGPGATYDTPYAYVVTGDGMAFPLVLVSGEQMLPGDIPATVAGLRDIDAVTYETQLRSNGLANLDALASAWTGLLSETLGMERAGAASLLTEVRGVAQNLHSGAQRFTIYPGVDSAASRNLAAAFEDDVALANASPGAVLEALGGTEAGYTEAFATRLISRARANVQTQSWSLGALDIGSAGEAALGNLGIYTLGGLVDAGSDMRENIKSRLNLNDDALDRLVLDAQALITAERTRLNPTAGVATLAGVTPDRAAALVKSGLGTITELANADRAQVAQQLNISVSEATDLVNRAIEASGTASIANVPGITAEAADQLRSKGILSVGDLSRADASTVASILGDDTLANRVQTGANVIVRVGTRGALAGGQRIGGLQIR